MSFEKDITTIKALVEKRLPQLAIERLQRLFPIKEYRNVDLVMRDGSIIEKVKIHNCSDVVDDRDIKFEDIVNIKLRFINPPISETVIVPGASIKANDFPIALFWYNISTEELDYEPFTKGLYHAETKGYEKYRLNPLVIRGRVFKDGDKNYILVNKEDFRTFEFAKPKLDKLTIQISGSSGLHISGVVSEDGSDLLERKTYEL